MPGSPTLLETNNMVAQRLKRFSVVRFAGMIDMKIPDESYAHRCSEGLGIWSSNKSSRRSAMHTSQSTG